MFVSGVKLNLKIKFEYIDNFRIIFSRYPKFIKIVENRLIIFENTFKTGEGNLNFWSHSPVNTSHNVTVLSVDAETTRRPDLDHESEHTG